MSGAAKDDGPEAFGRRAEDAAADFLTARGFRVLDRNYLTPGGELDLVAAAADGTVVFVEVKAARARAATDPRAAFTPKKVRRVYNAALTYLQNERADEDVDFRFDFVVVVERRGVLEVEHYAAVPLQDWLGDEGLSE